MEQDRTQVFTMNIQVGAEHNVSFTSWTSVSGLTVPLKSKLTLEPRNSRLDPCISKFDSFEIWDVRIKSRDARIESRVLMIEDQEARFLHEIIFVFQKNNVVQSCSESDTHVCGVL